MGDALEIANRRTILGKKPHTVNPSGIGRRNCGCQLCRRDREDYGCQNPGKCIETAQLLIDSIHGKWNPTVQNRDLCEDLALTNEERESNEQPIKMNLEMVFDPNFRLSDLENGFRIFSFQDSMETLPARRYRTPGEEPGMMTVFLHASVLRPGEFEPNLNLMIKTQDDDTEHENTLTLTFDRPEIPLTFSSALLGGLLITLQNTERNVPLLICSSSDVLLRMLIKDRQKFENNVLDPTFCLLRAVIARLNERIAKVKFKKVSVNPAKSLSKDSISTIQLDTELDLMFENPGIPLAQGSQRFFTKIIRTLRPRPTRKFTFTNLDRIRCSVQEISGYTPADEAIWKSIRSLTLQRLTREFFWKCIHNTFRVGDFWSHIETLEINGTCHACNVPESLEHIALECSSPGQKLIWDLTQTLWSRKYKTWPTLNWGLILGCNLVKFKSSKGVILPEKGRLFAILVSIAWHLLWNLRRIRVIENPERTFTIKEIHNQWLNAVNRALRRDCLLTDKLKFGPLTLNKPLVLNTWSGLLMDEHLLPDDSIHEGVLVGIRPMTDKHGIG